MSPVELEHYLHKHIPISKAMQISVLAAGEEAVVLAAPLEPNINHRETVFGGSASAVAILAAWSLLHTRLRSAGVASRLVIQRNTRATTPPFRGHSRPARHLHNRTSGPGSSAPSHEGGKPESPSNQYWSMPVKTWGISTVSSSRWAGTMTSHLRHCKRGCTGEGKA